MLLGYCKPRQFNKLGLCSSLSLSRYASQTQLSASSEFKSFVREIMRQRIRFILENSKEAHRWYQDACYKGSVLFGNNFQRLLMEHGVCPPIPGLIYIPNFVNPQQLKYLTKQSLKLYKNLQQIYKTSTSIHKSFNHNLSSDKYYKLLRIQDNQSGKMLNCQMFVGYGSPFHDLVYFIDNPNIPSLINNSLMPHLNKLSVIKDLQQGNAPFNWRLTLNLYKQPTPNATTTTSSSEQSFMWHKDIPVNGIITSITSVLGAGIFEIKDELDEEVTYQVQLRQGDWLGLTAEARWRWVHRVLRDGCGQGLDGLDRVSIVLGCK